MRYIHCVSVLALVLSVILPQAAVQAYKEKEGSPKDRDAFFFQKRAYPFGSIPDGAYIKAQQRVRDDARSLKMGESVLSEQPTWRQSGPYNVGGRVRSVAVNPKNTAEVYIGAAAGGVWKSTDSGRTWRASMDFENASAMGALAIDPSSPNVLYAATGEMGCNADAYLGAGIFKSTDAGQTWSVLGLTNVGAFSKIYVHPSNSSVVVAGGASGNGGFYKSTNGGISWQRTLKGNVSDISWNPRDINELFIGVIGVGIFRSVDAGETWIQLGIDPISPARISVQQAPSDPTRVYALIEQAGTGVAAIMRSLDRGQSWQLVYDNDPAFFRDQGCYNNYIAVHPSNPDRVIAGGIDIFLSIDGGATWRNTTEVYEGGFVHPDQHAAAFDPVNPSIVYVGTDGGMYRSTDAGATWTRISDGLAITQYYAFDIDRSTKSISFGGTQDNGTVSNTSVEWGDLLGGDGSFVAHDYGDKKTLYATMQFGQMARIDLDSKVPNYINTGIDPLDSAAFISPIVMHPSDPKILYNGRSHLNMTINGGATWFKASPNFGTRAISAIAISPVDPFTVWVGTARGEIHVTRSGNDPTGRSWINLSGNGIPNRFVSDIVASPRNVDVAYASMSGYNTPHLVKTEDLGKTWSNIGEGLPDVPINAIALHPDSEQIIFVGTDLGVYATYNGGESWFPFGRDLPTTPIVDLRIYSGTVVAPHPPVLVAATHGRSTYEIDIPAEYVSPSAITKPTGGEVFFSGTMRDIGWYGFGGPVDVEYSADNGLTWLPLAQGVQGTSLSWKVPDSPTFVARVRVKRSGGGGANVVSSTFTIEKTVTGSVLSAGSVSFIPYGLAYDGRNGLWVSSFFQSKIYKLDATSLTIEKVVPLQYGDSSFTDITIEKSTGHIYLHKINGRQAAAIVVVDTNGGFVRSMATPARSYPIGLEFVGERLVASERDGSRWIYELDPKDATVLNQVRNPVQFTYGPRCFAYDGKGTMYQATTFFAGGSGLTAAYAITMAASDMSAEKGRVDLVAGGGIMNARGIEYDPRDGNLWLSDFSGNIYKVAGFNPVSSGVALSGGEKSPLHVFPQPASDVLRIAVPQGKGSQDTRVRIFDAVGQKILEKQTPGGRTDALDLIELDLQGFSSGTYYLELQCGSQTYRESFLVWRL